MFQRSTLDLHRSPSHPHRSSQHTHRSVVGLKTPVSCVVGLNCVTTDFMAPSHYSGDLVESVCSVPSFAGRNLSSYLPGFKKHADARPVVTPPPLLKGKSLQEEPPYGMPSNLWSYRPNHNTLWRPAILQDDFGDASDGGSYSDPFI